MSVRTALESPQALADRQSLADRVELANRVEQCVRSRTSGMIRGLRVEVNDGQVVITGRASTYYAKQLVTHAAFDAIAELPLCNEVEVC